MRNKLVTLTAGLMLIAGGALAQDAAGGAAGGGAPGAPPAAGNANGTWSNGAATTTDTNGTRIARNHKQHKSGDASSTGSQDNSGYSASSGGSSSTASGQSATPSPSPQQ
jgi:hypothetical protein